MHFYINKAELQVPPFQIITNEHTVGGDGNFSFHISQMDTDDSTIYYSIDDFNIQTIDGLGSNLTNTIAFQTVQITQDIVSGWQAPSVNCVSDNPLVTITSITGGARIIAQPYSSITCDFTNEVAPTGNSNILFLPGIMGSRLYEEGLDCGPDIVGPECGDQELWVSTSGPDQAKLTLDNLGKSINNLFTKDDTQKLDNDSGEKGLIDEVSAFNIYQSFITDLKNWKQDETIADYAFIPYDWRLSLNDIINNGKVATKDHLSYSQTQNFSESFILKKLEALQKNSKSGKVTIIAHSQGGLVTKALIQKLKDTNNPLYDKIDKIILIAVPQVGTPDAVASLLHGTSLGYGLIMDNKRSRQLSENMQTIYKIK